MNRIVLIGNGFDLAHNLPTSYNDFLTWYWSKRIEGLRDLESCSSDDGLCNLKITTEQYNNWKDFIDKNSALAIDEKFSIIFKERAMFLVEPRNLLGSIMNSQKHKHWVDIENEYYSLLLRCLNPFRYGGTINKKYSIKDTNKELDLLKEKLIEYLRSIPIPTNCMIASIKDKIYSLISQRDISIASGYQESIVERIMLLNFNYTDTAKQYCIPRERCSYVSIHGELTNPPSIIFGYGDEKDSSYQNVEDYNDNSYLENIKSIRYLESDKYRTVLQFAESAPFQICIMGHSCGNSDRTLLHTLFEHKNCISIKPYYHKTEDKDNYLEIVQNISRDFNDKATFRDRVVNKEYCKPLIS